MGRRGVLSEVRVFLTRMLDRTFRDDSEKCPTKKLPFLNDRFPSVIFR